MDIDSSMHGESVPVGCRWVGFLIQWKYLENVSMEEVYLSYYFRKIKYCADNIDRLVKNGMSSEEAWNNTSIELTEVAKVIKNQIYALILDSNAPIVLAIKSRQYFKNYCVFYSSDQFTKYSLFPISIQFTVDSIIRHWKFCVMTGQ